MEHKWRELWRVVWCAGSEGGQPSGDGFQVRRQQRGFCSEIGLVECGCAGGLMIHTEGKVLQEGEGWLQVCDFIGAGANVCEGRPARRNRCT